MLIIWVKSISRKPLKLVLGTISNATFIVRWSSATGPRALGSQTQQAKEVLERWQKGTIVSSFATGPVSALVGSPAALLEWAWWEMAADAAKSVPGSQGTPATKLTSVTSTKGCTVTTQQTGLGTRPECVHVSVSFWTGWKMWSLDRTFFLQVLHWNNHLHLTKSEVGLVFMHQWDWPCHIEHIWTEQMWRTCSETRCFLALKWSWSSSQVIAFSDKNRRNYVNSLTYYSGKKDSFCYTIKCNLNSAFCVPEKYSFLICKDISLVFRYTALISAFQTNHQVSVLFTEADL